MTEGFAPPPYPYEALEGVRKVAASWPGGAVDLSIGTPCDPVPEVVASALSDSDAARPYPSSVGGENFLDAVIRWVSRQLGVDLGRTDIGACIGTKEFVVGLPGVLQLRSPDRDTVLYPAVSYPSYAMGATLAGCRAVPIPLDKRWNLDLAAIGNDDASRALCLWVNTPSNPTGTVENLADVVSWGQSHGVTIASDECYLEFTWKGPVQSVLQHGLGGVLAVHSLSKRSNLAGLRVGFYAGDPGLVDYLREVRKHQGLMVSGPAQVAGAVALDDQTHVEIQRGRYRRRLEFLVEMFSAMDIHVAMPDGAFYLWVPAPDSNGWALVIHLATEIGLVASPGEFYGKQGVGHVRIAAAATDDRMELLRDRIGNLS